MVYKLMRVWLWCPFMFFTKTWIYSSMRMSNFCCCNAPIMIFLISQIYNTFYVFSVALNKFISTLCLHKLFFTVTCLPFYSSYILGSRLNFNVGCKGYSAAASSASNNLQYEVRDNPFLVSFIFSSSFFIYTSLKK